MVLKDSSGGVGAKYEVPDLSCAFSCLATSLDLYLGLASSPLTAFVPRPQMVPVAHSKTNFPGDPPAG